MVRVKPEDIPVGEQVADAERRTDALRLRTVLQLFYAIACEPQRTGRPIVLDT